MDKNYLQDVAEFTVRAWWKKLRAVYPAIQENVPVVKLNNRLKTTAGRAFLDNDPQSIDLSTELFWEHTEQMVRDTIPHELAHLVAYTIFGDEGHGTGWKSVVHRMDIPTTRLHNMVNSSHAMRRAK